ncbi:MAG: quinolinate synthase [Candidatus Omnitrophica bacterium CG1_02_44_16]|nr:MAG: quinolinate synthase [Candidatus Omnitrophica bacterium CG1_02_44_16]PIY83798.1 MAG: quinolinate synthase [Candidatus Omnitrophica bacterium CG_4_10_14_0_8_um_filter_44_12]
MLKELVKKIEQLKKGRNAVILVHNYQLPEVQDIADFSGDSLGLSREAAKSKAKVIVFCGVYFMAETASILCPDKIILIADPLAGCPMANMITVEDVKQLKKRHPKAVVVGYVNTPADVKAELDVCCTSANAVEVVSKIKDDEIIFVPDKYLGDYVSKKTGKRLITWEGYCPTHVKILPEDIVKQVRLHPGAEVMVHPECRPEVIELADHVFSTGKMCTYVKRSPLKEFIIGTETGMVYRLQKDNPGKKFYPATEHAVCPNMKRTTLEKVLWSLQELKTEVRVSDEVRRKARRAIDKMVELA